MLQNRSWGHAGTVQSLLLRTVQSTVLVVTTECLPKKFHDTWSSLRMDVAPHHQVHFEQLFFKKLHWFLVSFSLYITGGFGTIFGEEVQMVCWSSSGFVARYIHGIPTFFATIFMDVCFPFNISHGITGCAFNKFFSKECSWSTRSHVVGYCTTSPEALLKLVYSKKVHRPLFAFACGARHLTKLCHPPRPPALCCFDVRPLGGHCVVQRPGK